MRRAVLLVAVSACTPSGLLIEIKPPPNGSVASIELFVGNHGAECGGACAVTPPDPLDQNKPGALAYRGTGWLMAATVADRTEMTNGVVRILVQTDGSEDQKIPRLLAVGLASDGSATAVAFASDLEVSSDSQAVTELTLVPAVSLEGDPNAEGIRIWRRPTDRLGSAPSPCAVTRHPGGDLEMFLPKDDTDCDDAEMVRECDPWVARATTPPPLIADGNCFVQGSSSGMGEGPCRLAGPPCRDGMQAGTGCMPTSEIACVPEEICKVAACTTVPCVFQAIRSGAQMPSVSCFVITKDVNGIACAAPSQQLIAPLSNLGALLGATGPNCGDVLTMPLVEPIVPATSWTSSGLTIGITDVSESGCHANIAVSWANALPGDANAVGLIDLVTATTPVQHRIVPIRVVFGSTSATSCPTTLVTCGFDVVNSANTLYGCR